MSRVARAIAMAGVLWISIAACRADAVGAAGVGATMTWNSAVVGSPEMGTAPAWLLRIAVGAVVLLVLMVGILTLNIALRRRAQASLRRYKNHLELLVDARTQELRRTNRQLEQEIVERRRAEDILLRRERILEAMELAAQQFLRERDWEEHIDLVLEHLARAAGICRVCIVENLPGHAETAAFVRRHEWCATWAVPSECDRETGKPVEQTYADAGIAVWPDRLANGEVISGRISDFEDGAVAFMRTRRIKTVAVIPVFVAESWWGFMEFDDCTEERAWPTLELDTLKTAASILGEAILRKRNEQERDALAMRVQRVQRLESLSVLAGGMAHDFNNILTGILGNADLALAELPRTSPAATSVEYIKDAALRASKLTGQMLACAGKGRFAFETLDINAAVRGMSRLLKSEVPESMDIQYALADAPLVVEVDPSQLKQVVLGLVSNAAEACGGRGGTITVTTGELEVDQAYLAEAYAGGDAGPGHYIALGVRDTGAGMDEATIPRIFEPFFTSKVAGRGLGLAAILGIVRGHGGAIRVDSRLGEGSTFTVLFPTAGHRDSGARDHSPVAAPPTNGAERTVLVIDDDETIRNVTALMLGKCGFRVLVAPSGRAGIELFAGHYSEIDVTLLDLTMPDMNGDEVLPELLARRTDARVILTSGYTEEDVRHRFAVEGMCGFIQKPFEIETLARVLRAATTPEEAA